MDCDKYLNFYLVSKLPLQEVCLTVDIVVVCVACLRQLASLALKIDESRGSMSGFLRKICMSNGFFKTMYQTLL